MKSRVPARFQALIAIFEGRFWALCLALIVAGMALPSAQAAELRRCHVWIEPGIRNQKHVEAALKSKGYTTEAYSESPRSASKAGDFFIFVGPGRLRLNTLHVAFSDGRPVEIDPLADNVENFPFCSSHEELMTEFYFRLYYGEMARRRLNTPTEAVAKLSGLGDMIMEVEALKQAGYSQFMPLAQKYKRIYANVLREVKKRWESGEDETFEKRIDRVRVFLKPFTTNYFRELNHMSLLFTSPNMGNCVSTTLLYVTLFRDAQIDLGPDRELVVQMFQDHVQPMIWEHKTKRVISLVSGTVDGFNGSLYDPEMITWALANAAGRAMHSERELFHKRRTLDLKHVNLRLGARYFFGDKTGGMPAGGMPYLLFDNSYSFFGDGNPPPLFGTQAQMPYGTEEKNEGPKDDLDREFKRLMEEAGIQPNGRGNGLYSTSFKSIEEVRELVEKMKRAREGQGQAKGFKDKSLAPDDSTLRKIAHHYVDFVWQGIPRELRPNLESQISVAEGRIIPNVVQNTQGAVTLEFLLVRPLPYVRAVRVDELDEFKFELPYSIRKIQVNGPPPVSIDQKNVRFDSERVEVLIRNSSELQDIPERPYDSEKLQRKFNRIAEKYFEGLKVDPPAPQPIVNYIKSIRERKDPASPADLDFAFESLNKVIYLSDLHQRLSLDFSIPTPFALADWLGSLGFCDVEKELSALGKATSDDPASFLKHFDTLLPMTLAARLQNVQKAQSYFRSNSPIINCNNPDGQAREMARRPLYALLNHLVVSHEQDPHPKMRRPPQFVPIELVFGGDQEGKIVTNPKQARPAQDGMPVGSLTPQPNPADGEHEDGAANPNSFNHRIDTVVNVLFAQPHAFLKNPAVQLKAFSWWNKDAQAVFESYWAQQPQSVQAYQDLWRIGSVSLAESIFPPEFRRPLQVYDAAPPLALSGEGFNATIKVRAEVAAYLKKTTSVQEVRYSEQNVLLTDITQSELENLRNGFCEFDSRFEIGPFAHRPTKEWINALSGWSVASTDLKTCPSTADQGSGFSIFLLTWRNSGPNVNYETRQLMDLGNAVLQGTEKASLDRAQVLKQIEDSEKPQPANPRDNP